MVNAVTVDIIILSNAKNENLRSVTEQSISTLLDSENSEKLLFNIIVLESNSRTTEYQFPNTQTIYPKQPFGYNKFMNMGLRLTSNEYVCLCNNDLIFHTNWASELLKAFQADSNLQSASPICSKLNQPLYPKKDSGFFYGYNIGNEVSGWCIFLKRSLLDQIGYLDERFKFWFSDNDYANTLKKHGFKHALVTSSVVDHMISKTLISENEKTKEMLMYGDLHYYEYKWIHHNLLLYFFRETKGRLKKILF